jgi:tRNA 2-selenouridine synthase
MAIDFDEFLKLRAELPLIDVRSEGEFGDGHIKGAVNIPILNNDERRAVGTDYKQKGQREAIMTGFRLVGPRLPEMLMQVERVADGREILVHCWRGGMRSNNFCQFAGMAKIKAHSLSGGYKTYRGRALDSFKWPLQLRVIGGATGSGKSDILRELKSNGEQIIDLELLASHKGSAFGGLTMPPQPTTEQFQNDLFESILTLDISKPVWIEDESLAIGRIFLPHDFWQILSSSPVIEISLDQEKRVDRLNDEYGPANREKFLEAMTRITKRLGPQNFKAAKEKLLADDMKETIRILLTYYDKAYQYGLDEKKARIKATVKWNGDDLDLVVKQLIRLKNVR